MNFQSQFYSVKVVLRGNLVTHIRFEEDKINRQHLGAATFPVDETRYLPDNKYSICEKDHTGGNRPVRNVHVHRRVYDVLLGNRHYSVAPSSL